MEKLSTNVLVVGKSGVGKSSLLNYLFDKEIQKTGIGQPVTEKGIYPFDYQYDENFNICIYDTWGLEPNKSQEWKTLIAEEVAKHNKEYVKDWFNTIIYCLSANSERLEDFEIEIIETLLKEKNQIVIAITHCKDKNDSRAKILRDSLVNCTSVKSEHIVFVNNVDKKLIGKHVYKFGREEVFTVIIKNLWRSLKEKVPYIVKKEMSQAFEVESVELENIIKNQRLFIQRRKKLEDFDEKINEEFRDFITDVVNSMNARFKEAMNYYNKLSIKYMEINLINSSTIMDMPNIHYDVLKEFKKEVDEQVEFISICLEEIKGLKNEEFTKEVAKKFLLAVKTYLTTSKGMKESLRKTVNKHMEETRITLNIELEKMRTQLEKIDINQIEVLMLEEKK